MQTIEASLLKEKKHLEKIIQDAKERLKTAPEGHLRIQKKQGHVEYYYRKADVNRHAAGEGVRSGSCDNGRYLKKSEQNLARGLAQRDYDLKLLKRAEERVKAIDTFIDRYRRTSLDSIYEKLSRCRQEIIIAQQISDSAFVKQWLEVKYQGKIFDEETPEIITEKGERVRSKSEKIIADKLFAMGIPYRYEYPLVLEGHIRIYPDFTILRMPAREEVYLEHFGKLDDKDYAETTLYKLNTYEKNGIYMGVNLFITYETGKKPLNAKALDGLLKKVLCVEL